MTREELIDKVCPSDAITDCCSGECLFCCDDCKLAIENMLDEYEKKIRAEVTNKHFSKIMSFINTNNRGNSDYFIVDQIENYIAEQLKEQNK